MNRLRALWQALRAELDCWWHGARYVEADLHHFIDDGEAWHDLGLR